MDTSLTNILLQSLGNSQNATVAKTESVKDGCHSDPSRTSLSLVGEVIPLVCTVSADGSLISDLNSSSFPSDTTNNG